MNATLVVIPERNQTKISARLTGLLAEIFRTRDINFSARPGTSLTLIRETISLLEAIELTFKWYDMQDDRGELGYIITAIRNGCSVRLDF